jgi:PAS domain S-box-containing protein
MEAPSGTSPSQERSAAELRLLIDGAPVAFWTCLPDGSADFLNDGWLRYTNLTAEEAKGVGWSAMLHPDDVNGHLQAWQRSVETETAFEFESRIRRYDGEFRWHLARAEPVRDSNGRIIIWCGTNLDITARKQAEDALRRNEAYLAEAQRLSRTGSFSLVPTTGTMHWSEESFRIFEVDPSKTPTLELLEEKVHQDDRPTLDAALRAARSGDAFEAHCRIVLSGQRIKYIRIVGRLMTSVNSELTFAGAFMDYTDARIADEKLHDAHAALAHVTRVVTVGELASSIAHEINQPLTGIVSNGEACVRWLDRDIPDLNEVRRCVQQMVSDSRRAAEVMRRVRSFVRKAAPEHAPLEVNALIHETIPLIQREIAEHRASLELALAADLPAVSADRIQLQQVVINLVVNGLQAMDGVAEGSIVLTIRTERLSDEMLGVSVVDAGTGISPEKMNTLFEPFVTTKATGLGMGLSICRSIIETHGGEIWAENGDGRGVRFTFSLPVLS